MPEHHHPIGGEGEGDSGRLGNDRSYGNHCEIC